MSAEKNILKTIGLLALGSVAVFVLLQSIMTYDAENLPIVVVDKPAIINSSYHSDSEILKSDEKNSNPQSIPNAAVIQQNNVRSSKYDSAALQNSNLEKNIVWAFGGKTQRGWYLYKPLICQTIGVEFDVDDKNFAVAVAEWQKLNGLPSNGILDNTTLAVFVTKWQTNRLKVKDYASTDKMLIAPTADFYDASRAEQLRQVERDTFNAYKKMTAAAAAESSLKLTTDGKGALASNERFLKIVSSFRSRNYQNQLRAASPQSGRAGLAVNSPHFTGQALDIYVGGDPVSTEDGNRWLQINTPAYRWLVKNAAKFGFKPYFYEPWHWEYAPDED